MMEGRTSFIVAHRLSTIKNADMIVANNIRNEGAGFAGDTNVITMITRDDVKELPIMTKDEDAEEILDMIVSMKR